MMGWTSGIGSPGAPTKPTTVLAGTVSPSRTTILSSVPSWKLSASSWALSVSTSKIGSPFLTRSPSFLSHLTSLLSSTIWPSLGIMIG